MPYVVMLILAQAALLSTKLAAPPIPGEPGTHALSIACFHHAPTQPYLQKMNPPAWSYGVSSRSPFATKESIFGTRSGPYFFVNKGPDIIDWLNVCRHSIPNYRHLYQVAGYHYRDRQMKTLIWDHPQFAFNFIESFGDSLSDTGNMFQLTQMIPTQPYWNGRFSDGPTWVEQVAAHLDHIGHHNRAWAGSTAIYQDEVDPATDASILQFFKNVLSGNLARAVRDFVREPDGYAAGMARPLYTVWSGGNDILAHLGDNDTLDRLEACGDDASCPVYAELMDPVAQGIAESVVAIHNKRPGKFLVMPLPDFGIVPECQRYTNQTQICHHLAMRHNEHLGQQVAQLQNQGYPLVMIGIADRISEMTVDPASFGFSALEPCVTGGFYGLTSSESCPNPGASPFFDWVHPSSRAHCWFALEAVAAIKEAGWIDTNFPDFPASRCLGDNFRDIIQ